MAGRASGPGRRADLGRRATGLLALAMGAGTAACTLEDVSLLEAEDVVVAEVYVQVAGGPGGETRAFAWLHRTLEGGASASGPVPGAGVLLTSGGAFSVELAAAPQEVCVSATPVRGTGSCYATTAELAGRVRPGDELGVEVSLPGGGLIWGSSRVPGDFSLVTPAGGGRCSLAPLSPLEVRWTRSAGAWAYVSETLIHGLRRALEPQGIPVERDPLYLLGLSVSAADTMVVFPGEFGVFDRFDLDQQLAVALQKGLPSGTQARVAITAADRNYVNWIRGGNFNPSGQVKIPSLRGDGTGVLGATLTRSFDVVVPDGAGTPAEPACGG